MQPTAQFFHLRNSPSACAVPYTCPRTVSYTYRDLLSNKKKETCTRGGTDDSTTCTSSHLSFLSSCGAELAYPSIFGTGCPGVVNPRSSSELVDGVCVKRDDARKDDDCEGVVGVVAARVSPLRGMMTGSCQSFVHL
ncbi:hypothetical protein H2248_003114 [Termitomyces sp. 'cryptogamus']|nr:hypothetical protein H2248_003114 [Termitomyces sp. 'cryptogamus']